MSLYILLAGFNTMSTLSHSASTASCPPEPWAQSPLWWPTII